MYHAVVYMQLHYTVVTTGWCKNVTEPQASLIRSEIHGALCLLHQERTSRRRSVEIHTLYAGASGSSTYSHVPNFYLIWQEAMTHCSSKDLCETEVRKCENKLAFVQLVNQLRKFA